LGGRGIKFKFQSLSEAREYVKGLSGYYDLSLWLDRIDPNGHYERGNLRFVTPKESARNRNLPKAAEIARPTAEIERLKRLAANPQAIR
jgi:hypothetical protein